MMKVVVLSCLGFLGYAAGAATVCGQLKVEKVMCMTAPCHPLTSLKPTTGKPFAVVAVKGSAAEKLLDRLTSGTRTVCVDGQIVRENTIEVTAIRLAKSL